MSLEEIKDGFAQEKHSKFAFYFLFYFSVTKASLLSTGSALLVQLEGERRKKDTIESLQG